MAPSVYMILTFYSQDKIIVSTNCDGSFKDKTILKISTTMGPLVNAQEIDKSLATILINKTSPFGTRNCTGTRATTCLRICAMYHELYSLGWRAVGDSIFDVVKRRGNILFKLDTSAMGSGQPQPAVACLSIPNSQSLETIFPSQFHQRSTEHLRQRLSEVVPRGPTIGEAAGNERRISVNMEGSDNVEFVARKYKINGMSYGTEMFHRSMGFVVQSVLAMLELGYVLETSVSVFGDQQDLMIFVKRNEGGTRPHPKEVWALTVRAPRRLVLVNTPGEVDAIVRQQTQTDPVWKASNAHAGDFWSRRDGTAGKVAIIRLMRQLTLNGWVPLASHDGLYKNSFFLFHRARPLGGVGGVGPGSPAGDGAVPRGLPLGGVSADGQETLPKIISYTTISEKKLKYDDINVITAFSMGPDESQQCLAGVDQKLRARRTPDNHSIRVFDYSSFAYSDATQVAKQVLIFLVITLEMERLGYRFLTAANISGRCDFEAEEYHTSPHTWFFVQPPPEALASEADADPTSAPPHFDDEGLPTYEEAMSQFDANVQQHILNKTLDRA